MDRLLGLGAGTTPQSKVGHNHITSRSSKMNIIYNFMYALGMFCVLILAIHGFINLVENESKQCQVSFTHDKQVNVFIGEWKK